MIFDVSQLMYHTPETALTVDYYYRTVWATHSSSGTKY